MLSGIYEKTNPQKTIEYNRIAISFQDSLINSNIANGMKNQLSFHNKKDNMKQKQFGLSTETK